ncbi:MAG TPA: hypothetical protein PLS69_05945 [Terricaulis sp.]|nr:hypothetical protein [Terricaulis sp.]
MGLWTRDMFCEEEADVGVRMSQLANALSVWVCMRGQAGPPCTVWEAMAMFNTTQAVIEEAVREGYWLYQTGDGPTAQIGVDGE